MFQSIGTNRSYKRWKAALLVLTAAAVGGHQSYAEPFLAVKSGLHCQQCHISPAGGGGRTTFGALYGQNELPTFRGANQGIFTGDLGGIFRVGASARASSVTTDVSTQDDQQTFKSIAFLYLPARS